MFCCIIFELIIWNPTQLVNSPVFFFRCPLCSRWIGNCISALLVCVCECKAAVLYHIKLTTLQLLQSVLTLWAIVTPLWAPETSLCFLKTEEGSQGFSLCLFGSMRMSQIPLSLFFHVCSVNISTFWSIKQMMWRKGRWFVSIVITFDNY